MVLAVILCNPPYFWLLRQKWKQAPEIERGAQRSRGVARKPERADRGMPQAVQSRD